MKLGFYWIIIRDHREGPEIARLSAGMFFTTRSTPDGEIIAVLNDSEYVEVLSASLPEPEGWEGSI